MVEPRDTSEIEVTPEMIDAGEAAVWRNLNVGYVYADFSVRDLAAEVYRAMARREAEDNT